LFITETGIRDFPNIVKYQLSSNIVLHSAVAIPCQYTLNKYQFGPD